MTTTSSVPSQWSPVLWPVALNVEAQDLQIAVTGGTVKPGHRTWLRHPTD